MKDSIQIKGARVNNLKNISLEIPRRKLIVITGLSGSGKSSLVEDVLYQSIARTLHRARGGPAAYDQILGVEQINKVIQVDQQQSSIQLAPPGQVIRSSGSRRTAR